MPKLEAYFEVVCGRCGQGLCNKTRVSYTHKVPLVEVEPCQNCIDVKAAVEEAKGYRQGYNEGYNDGVTYESGKVMKE